jgi:hypothetical protein
MILLFLTLDAPPSPKHHTTYSTLLTPMDLKVCIVAWTDRQTDRQTDRWMDGERGQRWRDDPSRSSSWLIHYQAGNDQHAPVSSDSAFQISCLLEFYKKNKLPTPWDRVLYENLTAPQLVKQLPAQVHYGIHKTLSLLSLPTLPF